jgi:adenylate cyclase
MNFRIGITIGDVVERNGDLLGDGVNIAARLEGIAPVGGICVSRTVYEQVANKLSVHFADIGEQQVKNIPNPVHAFTVAMYGDDGRLIAPSIEKQQHDKKRWPLAAALVGIVALVGVGAAYFLLIKPTQQSNVVASAPQGAASPAPSAPAAATTTPAVASSQARAPTSPLATAPPSASAPPPTPAAPVSGTAAPPPQATAAQPPAAIERLPEKLVPEKIPLIADRARTLVQNTYMREPDHKALAISVRRIGQMTRQPDDETAKAGALEACQRATDSTPGPPLRCELFAVGDVIVSPRAHPPMPSEPWLARDPSVERPFSVKDVPLVGTVGRNAMEERYVEGPSPKALALAPTGNIGFFTNQSNLAEAARRALEFCGLNAGVPCRIIAVDKVFSVAMPTSMKITGFFNAAAADGIAPEKREAVKLRLTDNATGWSAVAIGSRGEAGVAVKATSEHDATSAAIADCSRLDQNCRVIAIGMFSVEPN